MRTSVENKIEWILLTIVRICCLILSILLVMNPISTPGGSLLFTLPLTLLICTYLFSRTICMQRGGWGLKVMYVVILVRYLIIPFFEYQNGAFLYGGNSSYALSGFSSSDAYLYSIIAMDIECIVTFWSLNHLYDKMFIRLENIHKKTENVSLSILGFILILFCLIFIVSRDVSAFIRIGAVNEALDEVAMIGEHGFDIIIIKPLMAFIVIISTAFFSNQYKKNRSIIYFVLAISIALISCIIIVGNNRMQMVYLALCAMSVLIFAFPEYKKRVYSIIFPVLIIIMCSLTLLKQFGVGYSDLSAFSDTNEDFRVGFTAYACGPENIAHTYDNVLKLNSYNELETFVVDAFKYNQLFGMSVLKVFRSWCESKKTIIDYVVDKGEMVSTAGQSAFYGHGMIGGLFIDVFLWLIIIRLLVYFEIKSKTANDIYRVYVYTWLSILFGVSMCYCVVTLWYNITYVPIFLWMMQKINNLGRVLK